MDNNEAIMVLEAMRQICATHLPGFTADDHEAVDMAIKALENDWIPCSERLPEINCRLKLVDQISDDVLVTDRNGNIRHAYLTNCGYFEPTFCTVEEGMSVDVIAWMPLPEPYREEAEV